MAQKQNYDLAVAYRICPFMSERRAGFSGLEVETAELCLRSFKATLGTCG